MAIRLTASWSGGKKFERLTAEWTKNAMDGVNKAAARVERQIKINAVKGGAFRRAKGRPWVPNAGKHLRRGDGTLVNSWRMRPAQVVGKDVEAHVSSWVPYAAIHEFGGTIMHHARTFLRGGVRNVSVKEISTKTGRKLKKRKVITKDFGRLAQGQTKQAWSVTIPKRPYVAPAVESEKLKMVEDVKEAIMRPAQ